MIDEWVKTLLRKQGEKFEWRASSTPAQKPDVSVILSTYNRFRQEGDCPCLLKRAVDSILNQKFTNFELILIDDNSSDGSKTYCEQIAMSDPRVQFYHFKKNSGLPAKRYNFGMSVAKGKYISFMFDDDAWEPNALEDLHHAIENKHKSCGMVYGIAKLYSGGDRQNVKILGGRWGWAKIDADNFISNNAVIVKRSAIDLVGGYDEDPIFLRNCDWDLWWRIGRKFKVGRIRSHVAIVYGWLPDSIGCTRTLDLDVCKKRQRTDRFLPLKINQKESLRCKIRSTLFVIYVGIFRKYEFKKFVKKVLPSPIYQFLKKSRNCITTTVLKKRM